MKRVIRTSSNFQTKYRCGQCGWSEILDNSELEECPECGNRDLDSRPIERYTDETTKQTEVLPSTTTVRQIENKYYDVDCTAYVLEFVSQSGINYAAKNEYVDFGHPSMQVFKTQGIAEESAKYRKTYRYIPVAVRVHGGAVTLIGGKHS